MIRTSPTILLALLGLLIPACAEQKHVAFRRAGRMDISRAFYYPNFANRPDAVLADLREGAIDAALYSRYLAGRFGTRYLEDLAFDLLVEKECRARGLVKNAPLLARSGASRRFHESGRGTKSDADGNQQRKFINEALRKMRVDALVGAVRQEDDAALRAMFDRRYGVDGERVSVRHLLVSFRATGRRLEATGASAETSAVDAAAKARAVELWRRLSAGEEFGALLASSDDRLTKSFLRDPKRSSEAGLLPNYNYQRYGDAFARAVRQLKVGGLSQPVASSVGYHLIQLVDRKITKLQDVEKRLREELGRGSAKPVEVAALRRALLEDYGFVPRPLGK